MNNAKEFSGIKFDGIQILRAISALMVALYHIDFIYNLKINTAIGVDIFFVISGFIIMYTTQSNLDNYAKKKNNKNCTIILDFNNFNFWSSIYC
ncbi:MAG: acyltransferase family protein [Clostridia bacterium]